MKMATITHISNKKLSSEVYNLYRLMSFVIDEIMEDTYRNFMILGESIFEDQKEFDEDYSELLQVCKQFYLENQDYEKVIDLLNLMFTSTITHNCEIDLSIIEQIEINPN